MLRRILDLPYAMIHRRTDARSFKLEPFVVLVLGALGSVGVGFVAWGEMSAVAEAPFDAPNLQFAFIGKTVEPVFFLVLVWIWYTVAGHLLAGHYRGRGPISRLFRTSAWTLVPFGVWNVIKSALMVVFFWGVDFPPDPPGREIDEEIRAVMELGLDNPVWVAVLALGPVFAVWSGYLLSRALQRVKGLDRSEARRVAAIPAGVYGLWLLVEALRWAGVL